MSFLFLLTFLKQGMTHNKILDVCLLTLVSFGFIYGVLSFIREVKEERMWDTLKYWFKKLFK